MKSPTKFLGSLLLALTLAACGGGGGGGGSEGGSTGTGSSSSSYASSAANTSSASSTASSVGSSARSSTASSTAPSLLTVAGAKRGADGSASLATFRTAQAMVRVGADAYLADGCALRKMNFASGATSTIAGLVDACNPVDGVGSAARFGEIKALTSDGSNLYVGESNTLRKLTLATGAVSTLATGLDGISGIVIVGSNIYLSHESNCSISKLVIGASVATTFAGLPGTCGTVDGIGSNARFDGPMGMASDGVNIYLGDSDYLRKIVIATGAVSTLAITSKSGFYDLTWPRGLVLEGNTLYIADTFWDRIFAIDLIAQTGVELARSITATSQDLSPSGGIVSDGSNLYVAGTPDWSSTTVITKRALAQPATVSIFAGASALDGIGTDARLNAPQGMVSDGSFIYVADSRNHAIRKYDPVTGLVSTLAGSLGVSGVTDGKGSLARFHSPRGIAIDGGNLYVTEEYSHSVRKIVIATGEVTTLAGVKGTSGATDGFGTLARFYNPFGIISDKNGALYVADTGNHTIRKIVIATGEVITVAGTAGQSASTDGIGNAARFARPTSLAIIGQNLYITTDYSDLRKMDLSSKAVSTPTLTTTGAGSLTWSYGLISDGNILYMTTRFSDGVYKIDPAAASFTRVIELDSEYGLVMHNSALYLSNISTNLISKVIGN